MRSRYLSACVLSGCLMTSPVQADERDPIEPFNRAMFSFNQTYDKYLLKPVAQGYNFVTPKPVQGMVRNFFANMRDVGVMVNDLLQGKPAEATSDFARIIINTTIGVGGLADFATPAGLEKHDEDTGQTFAKWGYCDSMYLVLPFLGPSTVRDTMGYVADVALTPYMYLDNDTYRYGLTALNILQKRTDYLGKEGAFNAVAVDQYTTMRDFYFQHRAYQISDGQIADAALDTGAGAGTMPD